MEITGARVLLTGGGSGIGRALALALAAKGARLLLTGRRDAPLAAVARELEAQGGEAGWIAADVTSANGRELMLAAAKERLGGLDILVNNAGGVRAGRLESFTDEEVRAILEVNTTAPILLTRDALPALREGGSGLVVNIASGIALVAVPFYAVYAASKAGITRFGEALRRELKGEGVSVLTVYPGATDTPMMASSGAGEELGFKRDTAANVARDIVEAIEADAFDLVRGGEARRRMIALDRKDPEALDRRFLGLKPELEAAVRDHRAL